MTKNTVEGVSDEQTTEKNRREKQEQTPHNLRQDPYPDWLGHFPLEHSVWPRFACYFESSPAHHRVRWVLLGLAGQVSRLDQAEQAD